MQNYSTRFNNLKPKIPLLAFFFFFGRVMKQILTELAQSNKINQKKRFHIK